MTGVRSTCSPFQSSLKGKRFDEILQALETATLKHTERRTLSACAATWSALLNQEGAPGLHEAVELRHRRLVTKLVGALKPLTSALGGGGGKKKSKEGVVTHELLDEAQVGRRRLAHSIAPSRAFDSTFSSIR